MRKESEKKERKAEKKKFNLQERRWAPKVIETEDQEGNTILKHTTGSIAITKDAFIERYHGVEEWNAATVRLTPTQAKRSRDTQLKKSKKKKTPLPQNYHWKNWNRFVFV